MLAAITPIGRKIILKKAEHMKMIPNWLGHLDMGTTANMYRHVDHTSKLASAEVIGNNFRRLNAKKSS